MSRQNLTPVNIPAYAANPVTPTSRAGDMYYNTASNAMFYYTGAAWTQFQAGGSAAVAPITNFDFWSD
jgi:hypothetical protein